METNDLNNLVIDPRIKLLSYSSLLTLHSCPRKFQLYRLKATDDEMDAEAASNQNLTFAFGHIVGEGIQAIMEGIDLDTVIFKMFLGFHADLFDNNPKQVKSFWEAVIAIQKFKSLKDNGFLDDWELLEYNGRPAVELSFRITFPDGFQMRGSLDAALKHKHTGAIKVLECKTSSATNLNPVMYRNSAQGIGYSVILDTIAPDISSYEVLYLVYLTKQRDFEQLVFNKSYLQRAQWIQELLLDIETIKMYESTGVYPMRGESCYSFFRECEYINQCTLNTKYITKPYDLFTDSDNKEYDIELGLMDLINSQVDKIAVGNSSLQFDDTQKDLLL